MQAHVAADRPSYESSQEALLTVLVTDRRGSLEGASVRIEVTTPSAIVRAAEGATGADGVASLAYRTDAARDGSGIYAVDAFARSDGYDSVLASTSFEVTQ